MRYSIVCLLFIFTSCLFIQKSHCQETTEQLNSNDLISTGAAPNVQISENQHDSYANSSLPVLETEEAVTKSNVSEATNNIPNNENPIEETNEKENEFLPLDKKQEYHKKNMDNTFIVFVILALLSLSLLGIFLALSLYYKYQLYIYKIQIFDPKYLPERFFPRVNNFDSEKPLLEIY